MTATGGQRNRCAENPVRQATDDIGKAAKGHASNSTTPRRMSRSDGPPEGAKRQQHHQIGGSHGRIVVDIWTCR